MTFKEALICIVAILALIMVMTMLAGCHPTHGINPTPLVPTATSAQAILKMVSQTDWLNSMFMLGVVASLFAAFNGLKVGWTGAGACVVGILLKGALANTWVYAILGCFLIGGVGLAVASVLTKNKALVEIVKGAQKLKVQLADPKANTSHILAKEQSKTTQKLVGDIKTDLKIRGEI